MDETGGNNYQLMGTSQLLSVPYSNYSFITGDTTRWRKSADDLYYLDGRVGIGTVTPLYNMDILSSSANFTSKLRLASFDYSKDIRLSSGNEIYDPHLSFTGADALRFMYYDGGYNELMRITSVGKVCIGTGTFDPWGNLDVRGNGTDDGAVLSLGNSDNSHRLSFFSGREYDPNPFIQWKEGDPLRFSTDEGGWSEKMRIASNGFVGIGTSAPAGILDIAGAYHFPSTDGSTGQVLQTDGSGTLSWVSNAGGGSIGINDLSDGITAGNSVFLGKGAGLNDDGSDNYNVSLGDSTLVANITGDKNTAIGYNVLRYSTSGLGNTGIGYSALNKNVSGDENTATGYLAMVDNTNGMYNTSNGYRALRSNVSGDHNTVIGNNASAENAVGNNNVVIGSGADSDNQDGSNNTIIGTFAGQGSSSSGNVFIGYRAGSFETQDNKLYIDNYGGQSPLIYGDFDNELVRINGDFEVHGNEIRIGKSEGFGIYNKYDNDCEFFISEFGRVGIGTESPQAMLDVDQTIRCLSLVAESLIACEMLQITGGADIAEPFNVTDNITIKPGMVLVIDPDNPGKLKVSEKEYDRCVAGIISGAGEINPGMIMGQSESIASGDYPVALSGRVYCLADATKGEINPGDLITTSDIDGYAMKATNFEKAQGAIIGKAMTSLKKGKGLVLVLVTLQ